MNINFIVFIMFPWLLWDCICRIKSLCWYSPKWIIKWFFITILHWIFSAFDMLLVSFNDYFRVSILILSVIIILMLLITLLIILILLLLTNTSHLFMKLFMRVNRSRSMISWKLSNLLIGILIIRIIFILLIFRILLIFIILWMTSWFKSWNLINMANFCWRKILMPFRST
jgi:hypothetical protein